jgi:hypothetical protein
LSGGQTPNEEAALLGRTPILGKPPTHTEASDTKNSERKTDQMQLSKGDDAEQRVGTAEGRQWRHVTMHHAVEHDV